VENNSNEQIAAPFLDHVRLSRSPSSSPPLPPPRSPPPPPSPSSSSHDSDSFDSGSSDNVASSDEDSLSEEDVPNINEQFAMLNDDERQEYLLTNLKEWGLRGITKTKVNDLLHILRPLHPFLPKSSKTLLKTPRSTETLNVGTGKFWYKGIKANIPQILTNEYFDKHDVLILDVSIDGLPLFDSSDKEFWPILGCFKDSDKTFIIGVFCGIGKPDLDSYLGSYIEEVEQLQGGGYFHEGVVHAFRVRDYVLDAVARSYIKQCIGHNGYQACEKCTIPGRYYMGRLTFVGVDFPLRTDQSFQAQETPHHHNGRSPLENIGTGMVSQFRLDAMHLVYCGVVKRIISFLIYRRSVARLTVQQNQSINEFLENISSCFPVEFNRLPRSLGNADKKPSLKATELRRLILYDAIVVFKGNVPSRVYRCILLLHCALSILCSSDKFRVMNEAAYIMLKQFVMLSEQAFGTEFVVYNVHSLQHLPQECLHCDAPLDLFSAFKYENYLKTIKQTLRTPVKPLQQLARRDSETKGQLLKPKPPTNNRIKLLGRRYPVENEAFQGTQFKRLIMKEGFTLSTSVGNRCFCTKGGDIVFLSNIIKTEDLGVLLAGRKFLRKEDFYDYPMDSSELGIFCVSQLERRRRYWKLAHVKAKMVQVPLGDNFVCFPLIHLNV
jgi:hypothetical protein